jgi:hypothetical protein
VVTALARPARAQPAAPETPETPETPESPDTPEAPQAPGAAEAPDALEGLQNIPVAFGADEVRFDVRARALEVTGHVHVDEPPFHLTSDALTLKRVPIGVELDGRGEVAFCPCLGTPLAVRFDGATVAPPHDLVLRDPVLEVFGVPVAWAPIFWLRSSGRVGLLPPEVAWRGADGLFVGEGVHVPWVAGDRVRGLDLRAGGYVQGGAAVKADLRTATTETRLEWDRLHADDGVGVASRGWTEAAAWDVDALRGRRAVVATTDVDTAARPFDRATGAASLRDDGWTVASGVRAVALRGGDLTDLGAGGPVASVRRAGALGGAGAYDATIEGGAVSGGGPATTTFARAEGGGLLASRLGAVGATLSLRGVGDVADDGAGSGAEGAGQARGVLSLPLVRPYASSDANDPWVHELAPRLEAAAYATRASAVLAAAGVPAGRGAVLPDGGAWSAAAGGSTAFARWGSRASGALDASAGVVGDARETAPALRARASLGGAWAGLRADFARVVLSSMSDGGAFVARGRAGPERGLHLTAHVAERDGVDPVLARALTDAPLEPSSGFLAAAGWTGGARLAVPVGPRVTARGGADWDFGARELVAAVGALELHDPCGCVVVRATVAHRIGRDGVDAWVTVDLPR